MDGVRLRVGADPDALVAALAEELSAPRDDPFEADLVAVTSPGESRWLLQRLGTVLGAQPGCTDGVAARIELPTAASLFADLEREVTGVTPDDDPWLLERLAWTMLRAFEAAAGEPWFREVAVHLSDDGRPGRRYGTARRLGAMFLRYARWRPELLTEPAAEADLWQSRLWALLVELVGAPAPWLRTREAAMRLAADPHLTTLPHRLGLWAPQRLAPGERELLAALGKGREVTLWWPVPGLGDDSLLARRLGAAGRASLAAVSTLAAPESVASAAPREDTLLSRVQRGATDGSATDDGSIRIHLSHGPDRQVEVLRDVLCDLFETMPGLEPRDVVVCAPQLGDLAPLVKALCTLDEEVVGPQAHPVSGLRVRVTDPSAARANPVLDVLWRLVDLATSRAQLEDLLALCASPPVARRFRLDDERLETLGELLERSGVRWGVDPASREAFGLAGINQNTWLAGLNRLLLGVTLSERELPYVSSVLPLDMVDSGDLDLVGAIAEIYTVVKQAMTSFGEPATPAGWVARFREVLDRLVDVSTDDAWQLGRAQVLLGELAAASGPDAPAVDLGDMRHLVADWLTGHPQRSTVLTGNLTVTTLDCLRHVPHRVVCLVGLDEASFPRSSHRSGDDLLERRADPEDPHLQLDDRQLFLDALEAARDAFVVVAAGRDQRTNEPLPLPAPVLDLLDAVRAAGADPRDVQVPHALQPYELHAEPTYDRSAAAARRALMGGPRTGTADRFSTLGLGPVPRPRAVTLADLVAFLRHPAREFLRHRVGSWYGITRGEIDVDRTDDPTSTGIPVELGPLEAWDLENRLLRLALSGLDRSTIVEAEVRRGTLPPNARGQRALSSATSKIGEVLDRVQPYRDLPLSHLDLAVDLPGGLSLSGRVPLRGTIVVEAIASKPSDRRLVEPWLRLLLLSAGRPDQEWSSVVCSPRRAVTLRPPAPEIALATLDHLVDLMLSGWDQPLPLPPRLGYELAEPQGIVDDERMRAVWGYDLDDTWRLFYTEITDLERAAEPYGGLRALARDTYGPLWEAVR